MCEDIVLHSVEGTTVKKIFKNVDIAKSSRIDQVSAKFLGAPVIAIHLANYYQSVDKTHFLHFLCNVR